MIAFNSCKGSITFDKKEDSTVNLQTILKVVNQLHRDGIIASIGIGGWFGWAEPLTVLDKKNQILYIYIKDNENGLLSNDEKAEMLAEELCSYCFEAEAKENAIGIRYREDTQDEQHIYKRKMSDSLGKILKH
jgi:hypothetical protein